MSGSVEGVVGNEVSEAGSGWSPRGPRGTQTVAGSAAFTRDGSDSIYRKVLSRGGPRSDAVKPDPDPSSCFAESTVTGAGEEALDREGGPSVSMNI